MSSGKHRIEPVETGFFLYFDNFTESEDHNSLKRFDGVESTAAWKESEQHAKEEVESVEETTFTSAQLSGGW